jgi:hypothetical protein
MRLRQSETENILLETLAVLDQLAGRLLAP